MIYAASTDIFLWRALAIFLLAGALAGVVLALLLIFNLGFLERLNRAVNRWISARRITRWLDRSIRIERWFYRHHRAAGAAIVLGASYVLVYFGILFEKANALQRMGGSFPAKLLDALFDALSLGLLFGSATALILGLIIWLRPSLLRGVEERANRWISSRRASRILDVPHGQVDLFVMRHARLAGWLLLLVSIYLLVVLIGALA